jgi:hypothetical protein
VTPSIAGGWGTVPGTGAEEKRQRNRPGQRPLDDTTACERPPQRSGSCACERPRELTAGNRAPEQRQSVMCVCLNSLARTSRLRGRRPCTPNRHWHAASSCPPPSRNSRRVHRSLSELVPQGVSCCVPRSFVSATSQRLDAGDVRPLGLDTSQASVGPCDHLLLDQAPLPPTPRHPLFVQPSSWRLGRGYGVRWRCAHQRPVGDRGGWRFDAWI